MTATASGTKKARNASVHNPSAARPYTAAGGTSEASKGKPFTQCLATSNDLFEIRSLSFIPPRGFAQLFADKNPGPDHVDFKLSASSDKLVLYTSFGQSLDQVAFANQSEGVSQGRYPNGGPALVAFPGTASPGASNYVASYTGPLLNELMARNVSAVYDSNGNTPDWVELYNPTASAFTLAGMGLATGSSQPQWLFPAGASIEAGACLRIWCDSSRPASLVNGANLNTGFSLQAEGDSLSLFNTNAQQVDVVTFGAQVPDLSLGRQDGKWTLLSVPTPGAANAAGAKAIFGPGTRIEDSARRVLEEIRKARG